MLLAVEKLSGCKCGKYPKCINCGFSHAGCTWTYCQFNQVGIQTVKKTTTLMDLLPVFCQYKSKGCQEILMREDMGNHENGCLYRPISCPYFNCGAQTTYVGHMDHMTQSHQNGAKLEMKFRKTFTITRKVVLNSKYYAPTQINEPNKTFYEVGMHNDQHEFHWIYFIGDLDEAKNYFYHAKVKNGFTKEELTYSGQVRSLGQNKEEITKAFNAFCIPVAKVKDFRDANSNLVIEYKIRNMKEEAKDDDEESGIDDDE